MSLTRFIANLVKRLQLYVRQLLSCQKGGFYHFCDEKRISPVKLIDTRLIRAAIPKFLSERFLRNLFHMENTE